MGGCKDASAVYNHDPDNQHSEVDLESPMSGFSGRTNSECLSDGCCYIAAHGTFTVHVTYRHLFVDLLVGAAASLTT